MWGNDTVQMWLWSTIGYATLTERGEQEQLQRFYTLITKTV